MTNAPFAFKASATLSRYCGFFADSARSLQFAIERAPASSIFFHLHYALFRRHFTTSEFLNDFAHWTRTVLGDEPLAELLAAVDPLELTTIETSRAALVAALGDYLGRMEYTPSVGFKKRFCFQDSQSFIYATGRTADSLKSFAAEVRQAPPESLFYHLVVAPLLEGKRDSDFAIWLRDGGWDKAAERVARLSPYSTDLFALGGRVADLLEPAPRPGGPA